MKTLEDQQEWIVANLAMLSAMAWKGYASKGRGALVMQLDDSMEPPPGVPPGVAIGMRIGYLPTAEFPEEDDEKGAHGMCERYDPKTQIVLVIEWHEYGTRHVDHHRLRALPPPPEAYRKYKKRLKGKSPQVQWWNN